MIGSGFEVTLLDPSASPIAALLPVGLSEELRQALAHHGVVWHFGTTVQRGSITTATPGPGTGQKAKTAAPAKGQRPSWRGSVTAYNFAPVSTHMPALSGRVHL
ncbi:MAG: hypothetical protein WAV14_09410 [Rhodoferax sp.]